jgi:beta-lactamase regulating signal transducer with metallopeptidase domain/LysM repeat protein
MNSLLDMLLPLFSWTLSASLHATVLVALVLLAQSLFHRQITPRWRSMLWLLVLARLVVPTVPVSSHSIFNWLPLQQPAEIAVTAFQPVTHQLQIVPLGPAIVPSVAVAQAPTLSVSELLALFWGAGAVALLLLLAGRSLSLALLVRRQPLLEEPRLHRLLDAACRQMGVTRAVTLVAAPPNIGPCLVGGIRPRIALPHTLLQQLSDAQLSHIFLHELAHLRRHDIALNWLLALLQTLHWPNLVLWYAFSRLRADRELACDALVLSRTGDGEATAYAATLLHILQHQRPLSFVPGAAGMFESKAGLKRRIIMLATFRTRHRLWSVLPITLLLGLGYVGLTAAAPQEEPPAEAALDPQPAAAAAEPQAPPTATAPTAPPAQPQNPRLQRILDSPVNVEFERIHISEIISFISESYNVNIVIDSRAVVPAPTGQMRPGVPGHKPGQVEGYVDKVQLKEVTLRAALEALLRSASLDYAIRPEYIWISTPSLLEAENLKPEIGNVAAPPLAGGATANVTAAAPEPAHAAAGKPEKHAVVRGDTPATIAAKHGVPLQDFLQWNKLTGDATLVVGQEYLISGDDVEYTSLTETAADRGYDGFVTSGDLSTAPHGWEGKPVIAALRKLINAEFGKEPLAKVLASLSKIADVTIVLDPKTHAATVPVTIKLQDVTLHEGLRQLLQDMGLVHLIRKNSVLVTNPALITGKYPPPGQASLQQTEAALAAPLTFKFERTKLREVLDTLGKGIGWPILIDPELIAQGVQEREVTHDSGEVPLGESLRAMLLGMGLDYRGGPGYLFISTQEKLAAAATAPAQAVTLSSLEPGVANAPTEQLDVNSLPKLTSELIEELGLSEFTIQMLREVSEDRPDGLAIVNLEKVKVGDLLPGTKCKIIGISRQGLGIEDSKTGDRYLLQNAVS